MVRDLWGKYIMKRKVNHIVKCEVNKYARHWMYDAFKPRQSRYVFEDSDDQDDKTPEGGAAAEVLSLEDQLKKFLC